MSKDKPQQPQYVQQQSTSELEKAMLPKVKELSSMPYESWLQRFTVPEEPLSTEAASKMTGLLDTDYTPTGYEDYLKKIKPEGELYEGAMAGYKGLVGEDYGIEDYKQTEKDYLDTVLGRYEETRGKGRERLQESLISENLLGSGPGYGLIGEYGEETAKGVGDISKQWAYEGIQRQMQQEQYQDALKRGDYASMYSIALQEANTKMKAEEMANMEKTYYEALERGDIEAAFNMGQLLKQAAQYPAQAATQAELGGLQPGLGLFGTMAARDTSTFSTAMQGYGDRLDYSATTRGQNLDLMGDTVGAAGAVKVAMLCVPEGTIIDAREGQKKVEDIRTGDMVYDKDDKLSKVLMKYEFDEIPTNDRFIEMDFNGTKLITCDMHKIDGVRAKDLNVPKKFVSMNKRSYDILTNGRDGSYRSNGIGIDSMIPELHELTKKLQEA